MNTFPASALFDLDGVLIDTETIYTDIWTSIEQAHPTGIDNFAHRIKGTTLPDILSTYFPDPDVQADVLRMLTEAEKSMPYPMYDGVTDFLRSLRAEGIPTAIVTSSNDRKMQRLYAMYPGFREFFDTVVTDADVTRSKPHPECYLLAAQRLGADVSRSAVFEDSFNGLKAGRAAGACVVALSTTNPTESLADMADAVIPSLQGLTPQRLRQLLLR